MTLEDAYPVIVTNTLAECREYTRGTRFPQIEPQPAFWEPYTR